MSHTCHAMHCEQAVPPKLLMCLPHWRMLHKKIQDAIWQCYRNGQEIDKRPSARYLVVQALAVADVAVRQRFMTKGDAEDHMFGTLKLMKSHLTVEDRDYIVKLLNDAQTLPD